MDDRDQRYVKEMTPCGYKCVHKPHKGGGGVVLLYKTDICITMHRRPAKFDAFECREADLTRGTAVH